MFFIQYVHLLTMVLWFGGMLFFSLVATPSIFQSFSKETAGEVVGVLFPKYFRMGYYSSSLMLVTLLIMRRDSLHLLRAPLVILVLMTALTLVSGVVVGSRARIIKEEIIETRDQGKQDALKKKFKKIHAVSVIINLTIILLSLVYLAYLPLLLRS